MLDLTYVDRKYMYKESTIYNTMYNILKNIYIDILWIIGLGLCIVSGGITLAFLVYDLTHGGRAKSERIKWALQGRLEKGRLLLPREDNGWVRKLIEQANDFPSPIAHDDMIDALSYIDQLADVAYYDVGTLDTFEPLDLVSGY
jgi:hypothetical protein